MDRCRASEAPVIVAWAGCASLVLAVWWLWSLRLARMSLHWRPQRAIVEWVQVSQEEGDDAPWFQPRIRYRYNVGTRTWRGSRVHFATPWTRNLGEAATPLRGIVVGSEITVFVHPRNHGWSVLVPGEPPGAVQDFMVTMLMVLALMVHVLAS